MIRVLRSPAFVPTSPLPSTARRRSVNRNRWLYRVSIPAFVAIFAMVALTTAAQALDSKSPDETSRESIAATVLQMRTSGDQGNGMPEIVLVSPRLPMKISSPIDIELRFLAMPPAKIVRGSLRILYGFFGFDITERLTKDAEVTQFGIVAKNADLPAGSHSITIEVSDDHNRIARKTIHFEITEANE